ncbi:TcpE family conjugal transfer membrane protein [Sulfoacidibacillus thermotolerans]|uniref:Uncharacterized protein n=1 Tax=Sulfoacidibacillus thermotolerans TaxID=1765684 RepID=A0A2U3D5T9_SULT2|nr:TcpE family conjugal transfer membrane protein [Sulfoacidibacillus thermotolerans]PWI56640.1 hypothetical protein BM613_12730 [Sulfoacidibacillus thermotolerans]
MIYRTYRELYRAKTEITRIGEGEGAIKLGRFVTVGLDVVGVGFIAAIFPGILIALFLHPFFPVVPFFVWQITFGFFAGWTASQFDPQGKTALEWLWDLIAFLFRKKWTDGFFVIPKEKKAPLHRLSFYAVEKNTAYATPVIGSSQRLTLHRPLAVKVRRDGTWIVQRSAHPLPAGRYKVQNGKVVQVKEAPLLGRRGS